MNLYPTRATLHVALAGTAMIAVGVALHRAPPVAFGGAILIAIALGRGLSLLSGTRLREAGFEMVWNHAERVLPVSRGEPTMLHVQLRNRGNEWVRATGLRAIASSFLHVEVSPREVELPPRSAASLELMVVGTRVGRWGVHGIALELRGMPLGGDGLYEAPLVFSNPFGLEVQPAPLAALLRSPRGGRSGRTTEAGRPARARGDGDEFRELRDHVMGDAFKRIAWRASARRGKLVVREMERLERDVVWLVLDVSVDGWAGVPGSAPLDRAVDEVAAVAARHLAKGDRVGLALFASRPRAWLPPDAGPKQAALITGALSGASTTVDADRCELDEIEVAARVAEHLRPLSREEGPFPTTDLDRLAHAAEHARTRAPFDARLPEAPSRRDRMLRHYLACFGIEAPPRTDGERPRAESEMARTLAKIAAARARDRASVVAIWAPPPAPHGLIARGVRGLRAHRTEVRWTLPDVLPSIGLGDPATSKVAASVDEAVRVRAKADVVRAMATLRALGVLGGGRYMKGQRPHAPALPSSDETEETKAL